MRGGGWSRSSGFCELDDLEDANALSCMELKGLRPVVVHGVP